jgi:hypothetical protein
LDNKSVPHPFTSLSQDGADSVEAANRIDATTQNNLITQALLQQITQWHGGWAASLFTKTIVNRFSDRDIRTLSESNAALEQVCKPYAMGLEQITVGLPQKIAEWYPHLEVAREITDMIFHRFDVVDLQNMLQSEATLKACCEEYGKDVMRRRLLEAILQLCPDRNLASQLADELSRDLSINTFSVFIQPEMIRVVYENAVKNKLQALRHRLLEKIIEFHPDQDMARQLSEMLIHRFNITDLEKFLQSEAMLKEWCDDYSMDVTRQTA